MTSFTEQFARRLDFDYSAYVVQLSRVGLRKQVTKRASVDRLGVGV